MFMPVLLTALSNEVNGMTDYHTCIMNWKVCGNGCDLVQRTIPELSGIEKDNKFSVTQVDSHAHI
jgi:hypothetical protein